MALNFPPNPQPDDQYTGDNGITYIFDGVKWIGRAPTLAPGTSSLSNNGYIVQVAGDGNLIIPVGKTILDTNGNPFTSIGPLDRITTGSYSVVLGADGLLTFPNGDLTIGNNGGANVIMAATDTSVAVIGQGIGGYVGFEWIGDTTTSTTNVAAVILNSPFSATSGTVQIATGLVSGPTAEHIWEFGNDGNITMPGQAAQPYRLLASQYGYYTTTTTVVIFTGTPPAEATKATIHVKGALTVGDTSTTHHQICEMLIARKDTYDANTAINTTLVEAMVYGVTHTSVTPIATFDARYNAITMCFEITMVRDPVYTGVNAKVIATESVNLD